MSEQPGGVVTFLFTDVEGSTEHLTASRLSVVGNPGWALLAQGDAEGAAHRLQEAVALSWEVRSVDGVTEFVYGLAQAAALAGRTERAASLAAAAEALGVHEDVKLDLGHLERARSVAGEERWQAAAARGASLTLEEAVEEALSGEASPVPPAGLVFRGEGRR